MKKKDKVTLKGVDKPEVFQHWTETSDGRKAVICYQEEKTGDVPLFKVGIDPYHIEPTDNPQKPDSNSSTTLESLLDDISELRKEHEATVCMDILKGVQRNHPEVLDQFIKEHYGK